MDPKRIWNMDFCLVFLPEVYIFHYPPPPQNWNIYAPDFYKKRLMSILALILYRLKDQ